MWSMSRLFRCLPCRAVSLSVETSLTRCRELTSRECLLCRLLIMPFGKSADLSFSPMLHRCHILSPPPTSPPPHPRPFPFTCSPLFFCQLSLRLGTARVERAVSPFGFFDHVCHIVEDVCTYGLTCSCHSQAVCARVMFLVTSANGRSDLLTALANHQNRPWMWIN